MPFAVTRLPNEPILLLQFDLTATDFTSSLQSINTQIASIVSEAPSPLYVFLDLTKQEVKYSDILLMIQASQDSPAGTPLDPRIRAGFVGTHPLLEVAVRKVQQMLGVDTLLFATVEEALDWARAEINRASGTP